MTAMFQYDGKCSTDFGMHVEKYPTQFGAVRKRTTIKVAGRNGDLHYVEDAFENYTQKYECYFHGDRSTPEQAHAIKGWLLGGGGYLRLEDVYDPEHFRLAACVGPIDVENILNKYGRCTVEFDCKPQAFLKSGEFPIDFENSNGTLTNPTDFNARPMICLYGTGAGTFSVNGVTVDILEIDGSMTLDCEMLNAFFDGGDIIVNKNACIYAPEFPVLKPGKNTYQFTGDIQAVRFIPRWWEL